MHASRVRPCTDPWPCNENEATTEEGFSKLYTVDVALFKFGWFTS